jgi:lipopolysaccharide export system protein LptC
MSQSADIQRSRRQVFAAPHGRLDRIIGVSRVVLPAGVGVLIALLALAPFTIRGDLSFVLDKNSVDVARERLRVREAVYRGEDSKGRPFSLRAASAVQKSSKVAVVELDDLSARILLSDGPAQLRAGAGQYDMDSEQIKINGSIQLDSAGGYRLTTNDVKVDLKARTMSSAAPVEGRTNLGTFRANSLRVDMNARTVALQGNARLRIEQNALRAR